jgi:signal transduction histidine kinase
MPLHRRHVPLATLAAEVMDAEAFLAREKELRLVNEVPRGLPPAWVDPDVVGRVLQNLVGNAIKFTPRGGVVRVGACPDGSAVADLRVSVVDTGAGIAADVRGRLFQTFVTGQQEGRGSGLGLAFCRLAVEAHGGRIWAEDPPAGGAAFHFTLPTAPPEA